MALCYFTEFGNGPLMALILQYFTEFVYDVVV